MRRDARFNRIWYEGESPALALRLLSLLFRGASALRRGLYRIGILRSTNVGVPVIVVGNLTAGGAGKTPLVLSLVRELGQRGFRCGIVSRGYGGKAGRTPLAVTAETSPRLAGDEPVLLARRAEVPVYVHLRRASAALALREAHPVDVILCDDGLQHYALARDIEIAVIDGERGLGNGRLLPAGPLREPPGRLDRVNHIVMNGELLSHAAPSVPPVIRERASVMRIEPVALVNLRDGRRVPPAAFADRRCAAIAGIGNPQRFFSTLAELGYVATCRAFPDHHAFSAADFEFAAGVPVLMTEKDAVKCRAFALPDWWYLEIGATLETALVDALGARLQELHEAVRRNSREMKR